MICKKSAGFIILSFLIGASFSSFSQSQWTYDFNNGLNSMETGGPSLKKLGSQGQYIKEKLPDAEDLFRTVYTFEKNSGLQFDDRQGKGFLSKSFSVEIYFKLDSLSSWKRVLDFKNRKSDYGSYIYEGKVNFYDYALSEKAPVKARQYVHYVYTRDFDTKVIKMYINGQLKVEFTDPGTEGVLDADQALNFFQDDLIANHEASSGSVALIRVYDRVMTPVFIRRSYLSITKPKKEKENIIAEVEETKVSVSDTPKKNPNLVNVTGKVFDGRNLAMVDNVNVLVRKVRNDSLVAQTKTVKGAYEVQVPPFESYKISVDAPGFQSKSILVSTANRPSEVRSLFSLSPERYDRPIATLFFTQSLETLESEALVKLDSIISYFSKREDLKIILKGHTDNIGHFDKNIALSTQRVQTVREYLTAKGIPNNRIEGVGYGPTRPNSKNQTEDQKKINRRVEVWAEPVKR